MVVTIVLVIVVTSSLVSSWDKVTIWRSFRGTAIAVVCVECASPPPWFADIWIKTPALDDALNMLLREYDWLLIVEDKEDFGKELVYQHHMLPQVITSGCMNVVVKAKETRRWCWSTKKTALLCHGKVATEWLGKNFDGFLIK